ncbi:MAG: hypothetical protein NC312_12490 [Bacteroides fragilis]|nr:hypothetical protein [Bacteroides fragilis]
MKERELDLSAVSWSIRFVEDLEHVITVLSGMSDLGQLRDNIKMTKTADPLSVEEKELLQKIVGIYKESGPYKTSDFSRYEGLKYHGAPVGAILDAYNICMIQPNPAVIMDNNYLKNKVAEEAHLDFLGKMPEEKVVLSDGTDITEEVKKAERYLIGNSF